MKTYKLTVAAVLALTLIAVTAMTLGAAPTDKWYLVYSGENAPILPNKNLKAHSEEWNNYYFDRNAATTLPFYFESTSRGLLRGGLAGRLPSDVAKPIVPKPGVKAHSDTWNNTYFDRHVNTKIAPAQTEYLEPGLRRGGMAKDAQMGGHVIASDDLRPMRMRVHYV